MDLKKDMTISIIIPCYNEEGNITELYKKIKSVLDEKKIEFIFICMFKFSSKFSSTCFIQHSINSEVECDSIDNLQVGHSVIFLI